MQRKGGDSQSEKTTIPMQELRQNVESAAESEKHRAASAGVVGSKGERPKYCENPAGESRHDSTLEKTRSANMMPCNVRFFIF